MRTTILRVLFVIAAPLLLLAAPASAKPDLPGGCDLLQNTHCHCIAPQGLQSCVIID